MLNRKKFAIGGLLCLAVLACGFWVFRLKNQNLYPEARQPGGMPAAQPPHPDSDILKEAQGHLEKLYALSGTLTPEERKVYLDSTFALEKLFNAQRGPLLPNAEYERFVAHIEELMLENPGIGLEHRPAESPEETYERQQRRQEELENVTAAIAEVKTSEDMALGAKEALLSILEHRFSVLQSDGSEEREMARVFAELKKTDPDIVGLEKDDATGLYTKLYPNMLTIYKWRIHKPDGTVDVEYAGSSGSAEDPDLHQEIQEYADLMENTPPWAWEKLPPPPEHEDLRFSVEYKDIYVDADGKRISTEQAETSGRTPAELPQGYPEPAITAEEVKSLKGALTELKTSDPSEWEKSQQFFEKAVGIPLDQFLEMTDAEIEAELSQQLSASQRDSVSGTTDTSMEVLADKNLTAGLRQSFSPETATQALQVLSLYGRKEGVRRLKAMDPEVAAHIENFLQKHGEK